MRDLLAEFVDKYGRLPTEVDPDYLEMLRMTKYVILDVPTVQPAKCANCGSTKNDGRKYIDFGLQVDWYGVVYLCGHCLGDIANAMGLFEEMKAKLVECQEEIDYLEAAQDRGESLHALVSETADGIKEYYDSLFVIRPSTPLDPPASMESDTGPDEPVKRTINATEQRVTKSTSGARPKNIRSLADLLEDSGD